MVINTTNGFHKGLDVLAVRNNPRFNEAHTYALFKPSLVQWILILFKISCEEKKHFAEENHASICSWNQSALSNEGKVSCSGKQQEPLIQLTGIH